MDIIPSPNTPNGEYKDYNPITREKGTAVTKDMLLHPQQEIVNTIKDAGLTPDKNDLTQLSKAVKKISALPTQSGNAGKYLKTDGANPLWDVVDALPPQSPATVGQVLQSTADGAVWGASSNFILLSAYVSNMELTGTDAAGWALSGSMVEGQNAVTALPVLTQSYNAGVSYGTGTIYATITGLKRAITLKKGLLIAPYTTENVNALNALWDAGKEANVWLLDTVNQRFMCPRTRNWTANTTGVNDFIEESLPNITGYIEDNAIFDTGASAKSDGALRVGESSSKRVSQSFGTTSNTSQKIEFNAHLSSSTYKDGATVQQNASTVYVYYRIYDGIKPSEDIVVEDLTQILTDLQNKADINADNFNQEGRDKIMMWGMPDYRRIFNIPNTTKINPYVAPYDGVFVTETPNNTTLRVYVNTLYLSCFYAGTNGGISAGSCYVPKGTPCFATDYAGNNLTVGAQYFVPLKGV